MQREMKRLIKQVDKEARDNFKTKWGYDIGNDAPAPGSAWKWDPM